MDGAVRHGVVGPHAQCAGALPVQDVHLNAQLPGGFGHPPGHVLWGEQVGGAVHQSPGEAHRPGHRVRPGQGALQPLRPSEVEGKGLVLPLLPAGLAVAGQLRPLCQGGGPLRPQRLDRRGGVQHGAVRPQFPQDLYRLGGGAAEGVFSGLSAQADGQHAPLLHAQGQGRALPVKLQLHPPLGGFPLPKFDHR